MNRGEKIYITLLVVGVMLPGIMLFCLFNIPFNRFIVDNWLIISTTSIATSIITVAILRIFGDNILPSGEKLK